MLIGYARTSTVEQQAGFDAQIVELKKAGCERTFQEQVSSVVVRPELDAAIDFAREGDTFVVTKLDRLARSRRPSRGGRRPAPGQEGGASHPRNGDRHLDRHR